MPRSHLDPIRAARHAALGDPVRLAIVDELAVSDRAPVELRRLFGIESNLLAHHLDVLEAVGLIIRTKSSGDGRRRYVHLLAEPLDTLDVGRRVTPGPAVFVCTHNSARSQLAAALWRDIGGTARSAGTHPARSIHEGAVAAASRAGLDLGATVPTSIDEVDTDAGLVVTVCDQAHEELGDRPGWLHWSVPDPVAAGTETAFDDALGQIRSRIAAVTATRAA